MLNGVKSLPVWLAVLLAVAIGGYWYYWQRVAERLPHEVEAWIAEQSRDGRHFSHQGIEIRGFPSRFEIHLDGPSVELTKDQRKIAWQWHQAVVIMQSWNLNHQIIDLIGDGAMKVSKADDVVRRIDFAAERAMASVRFSKNGELLVLAADIENLTTKGDSPIRSVGRTQFHLRKYYGGSEDRPMGSLSFASLTDDARFVVSRPAFGDTADRLNFSFFLNSVPESLSPAAVTRWRDDGGVVELRAAEMKFGEIEIKGNATLALDLQNRVEGAGTMNIYQSEAFLQALVDRGALDATVALGLQLAAVALEQEGTEEDPRSFVQLPFSLLDGDATVSGFPIFQVPPLY